MKSTSRPLIVLVVLLGFGSAALAGGTADYGILHVTPPATVSTTVAGK